MRHVRFKMNFVVACDGDKDDPLPIVPAGILLNSVADALKDSLPEAIEIVPGAKVDIERTGKPRQQRPRSFGEAMMRMHSK